MAEERKTTASLSEDLEALRGDIARLSETVNAIVRGEAEHLRERIGEQAEELRARGRAYGARARHEIDSIEHEAEEAIVRHPFSAVLMAAGIGLLLGVLVRGR